jgi:hypothetical protein
VVVGKECHIVKVVKEKPKQAIDKLAEFIGKLNRDNEE